MPFDHWLAFAAASAVMRTIPGPTVLLAISHALGHGRRPAAAIVAGVALGDLTSMTASMLGLGAVLATTAAVFTALRQPRVRRAVDRTGGTLLIGAGAPAPAGTVTRGT